MTNNPDCIFCKIAQKEFPPLWNGLFREDENYMARLSPFPNTEWFSVVIPKKHHDSDVLKMPDEDLAGFIIAAKKIAKILEDSFEDVWRVWLIMEWTWINHAHIKLFPMHGTAYLNDWFKAFDGESTHDKKYFETYEGYVASYDGERVSDEEIEVVLGKIKKYLHFLL